MEVSARSRVDLPATFRTVFEVYVGGVRQVPGRDYEVDGRTLVFPRPIAQEGRLGFWRWASMWLGIAGTYRKHETVDVVYEAGGRRGSRPASCRSRTSQSEAAARSGWRTPSSSSAATVSGNTSRTGA